MLIVRSGGMETGYFFGLSGNNKVRLFKKDHETVLLAESDYPWKIGTEYLLSVDAVGGQLSCSINNGEVLSFTDKKPLISGMAGLAKLDGGRTRFLSLSCREM